MSSCNGYPIDLKCFYPSNVVENVVNPTLCRKTRFDIRKINLVRVYGSYQSIYSKYVAYWKYIVAFCELLNPSRYIQCVYTCRLLSTIELKRLCDACGVGCWRFSKTMRYPNSNTLVEDCTRAHWVKKVADPYYKAYLWKCGTRSCHSPTVL